MYFLRLSPDSEWYPKENKHLDTWCIIGLYIIYSDPAQHTIEYCLSHTHRTQQGVNSAIKCLLVSYLSTAQWNMKDVKMVKLSVQCRDKVKWRLELKQGGWESLHLLCFPCRTYWKEVISSDGQCWYDHFYTWCVWGRDEAEREVLKQKNSDPSHSINPEKSYISEQLLTQLPTLLEELVEWLLANCRQL